MAVHTSNNLWETMYNFASNKYVCSLVTFCSLFSRVKLVPPLSLFLFFPSSSSSLSLPPSKQPSYFYPFSLPPLPPSLPLFYYISLPLSPSLCPCSPIPLLHSTSSPPLPFPSLPFLPSLPSFLPSLTTSTQHGNTLLTSVLNVELSDEAKLRD